MKGWARIVLKVYRALLVIYPRGFRSAFGEEMRDDFHSALIEIQPTGKAGIWQLLWREFRYWPESVWREHLRVRRMKMTSNRFADEKPLTRRELLAAPMLFLLPIISILLTTGISLPNWANILLVFILWGCIFFSVGLAVAKKLPRWSLPYLGVLLVIGLLFAQFDRAWTWTYPYFIQAFGSRSTWPLGIRVIYGAGGALSMILLILVGAIALVGILSLLPITRKLWYRIRSDWTQFSFLIYGSLVFFVSIAFEEFQYDELSKIIAWISLALGALLYLRSNEIKQRILALIGGATGAMWTIAISYWVLIPLQDWPTRYVKDFLWTDTSTAILGWVCFLLIMIAPALLNLMPYSPPPDVQENVSPT
ncbi:MAG: hypothetical protein PVJ21_10185 [Anaerolineales bacterium]|jgi:hypothetical protein